MPVAAVALVIPLGATAVIDSSSATTASPDVCQSRGPIEAVALTNGVSAPRCSLVGRIVIAGHAAVRIPPAGMGVGGDGVAMFGDDAVSDLQVVNMNGVVTASVGGDLQPTEGVVSRPRSAVPLALRFACDDPRYVLEQGGHPWAKALPWHYFAKSNPARWSVRTTLRQIALGNHNMRTGYNDCGFKRHPRAYSNYLGTTRIAPNEYVKGGSAYCGAYNKTNSVGWGPLPGGLLGWTCYWWGGRAGNMIAVDMRLNPTSSMVIHLPSRCRYKWDLQSVTTHEWGHAYGLAHPGPGHKYLTMAHNVAPCSTRTRTLGWGDYRGMRALYGLR
ncbi:MAG: matrixin family metalloprotease [Nocardioidaceae bacterium]